jgi:hypothetical protein
MDRMSTPAEPARLPEDDFVPTEELVRRQGVEPLASPEDLAGEDLFGSNQEYAEFLADLYTGRRASS